MPHVEYDDDGIVYDQADNDEQVRCLVQRISYLLSNVSADVTSTKFVSKRLMEHAGSQSYLTDDYDG